MIPNKNDLIELYSNQNLSLRTIAEKYNISHQSIYRLCKQYNLPTDKKQKSFEDNKNYIFNNKQREFLVGTLLGDAYLEPNNDNSSARLQINHCIRQKDYLEYKRSFISDICGNITEKSGKYPSCRLNSKCIPVLMEFRDLFYDGRKKIIRTTVLPMVTPFALAIWIMDDGSKNITNKRIRLHTENFTLEDNFKLQKFFIDKYTLYSIIEKQQKNGKIYYNLSFRPTSSITLSDIVTPYFIDSMRYKIF